MQSGGRKETKQARNSRGTWSCSQLRESPRPRLTEEVWGKVEGFHTPLYRPLQTIANATTFALLGTVYK